MIVTLDRLWAPWRMAYIKGDADEEQPELPPPAFLEGAETDCFLCAGAGELTGDSVAADRQRLVVRRQAYCVTMLNRFPYNNGHLLVAPRRHVAALADLTAPEQLEILQTLTHATQRLTELMQPNGFNIGLNLGRAAGAGIPGHLHWHIVPRWDGDANFMTVTSDTRVISQSLDALWTLLTRE